MQQNEQQRVYDWTAWLLFKGLNMKSWVVKVQLLPTTF